MNELALPRSTPTPTQLDTRRFPAQARWVLKLLERAEHGALIITLPDGQRACFGRGHPTAAAPAG